MEEPIESHNTQPSVDQAVFLEDLNRELGELTPEGVRENFAKLTGFEPIPLRPRHDVLTRQTERPNTPPKADVLAHTGNPEELQATIIAVLNKQPLSEEGIVQVIVAERGLEPTSPLVNNIAMRVRRALSNPLVSKRLVQNSDGAFSLNPSVLVGGGSDFSSEVASKRKEDGITGSVDNLESLSRIDRIKNKLADGAEWVEDGVNIGIDKIKERVVGKNKLGSSVEAYETAPTVAENPAYKKIIGKLQTLSKTFPAVANAIRAFAHFKVEDQKRFEDILNNLPDIAEMVPGSEYTNLVQLAKEGVEYELKGKYVNDPTTYGKKAVDLETEKASWVAPERPKVTQVKHGESVAEKFLREMAQSNEAKISNTEIATKIDRYVDEATYAIPLKELRKKLALAPAEDMVGIITNSRELTEEQRNELLTILGVQVAIPGELPYPDGYVPEPPLVVDQEPILVEDPTTRARSLNERMSAAVVAAQPVEMSQAAVGHLSTTRHIDPIGPLNKPSGDSLIQQENVTSRTKVKTVEEQIAEKVKPSQVIKENIPVPTKEESLVFGPMTKEQAEIDEFLRDKVAEAREDFAMYEVTYKKEIREKRKWYYNLMSELGAPEKHLPTIEKEQFHREAEEAYMEAKWNLKNFMAGRDVQKFKGNKMVFGEVASGARLVDVGLMDQAENEFRILQKQIIETTPLEEKSRIKKAFEVLARRPTYEKVIVGSALTALAIGLVGGGGVTAAFAMFGKRIIKSTAGVSGAIGTGKWIDGVKRKVDKEARADRFADYGEKVGATREDFEKEEKENEQFFKDQEVYDKRIRLAKAATMAVVGGLSAAGAGMVEGTVVDTFTTPGVKVNPDINLKTRAVIPEASEPKANWFERFVKKEVAVEQTPAPKVSIPVPEKIIEAPAPEVYPDPVAVPLSSKGFIDTIGQLKQATEGQKLTPALEKLLNQSPQKIAMDLGLYKPGQVAESAFGFQNEKLSIDINGNLSLEHTGGNEVLMDSKGTLKPFAGKMFDADKTATSPLPTDAVEVPVAPKVAEVIPQTPKPVVELGSEVSSVEIKPSVSQEDLVLDTADTASALVEAKPRTLIDFDQTVVKSPEYLGPQDMISGKLPLKPEYQFDPQYKPERTTYNIRLEKELMSIPTDAFDLRFPIEYNGGRINVFQKGNDLLILLNGQKIGTGLMIDGQPGLQYEKSLGTGVFGVKSDFEKAFETAEKAIMKNKMFFKKP